MAVDLVEALRVAAAALDPLCNGKPINMLRDVERGRAALVVIQTAISAAEDEQKAKVD